MAKKKEIRNKALTFRMLPSTRKKLEKICQHENRSLTNWIENAIETRYDEIQAEKK